MKDEKLKYDWLETYPVGSKVEVKWGRAGWYDAIVAEHIIKGNSVMLRVTPYIGGSITALYYGYGMRRDVRAKEVTHGV